MMFKTVSYIVNKQKCNNLFKLKQNCLYCEAGNAIVQLWDGQRLKDRNKCEARLMDLTWNAIVHQDSKTSCE